MRLEKSFVAGQQETAQPGFGAAEREQRLIERSLHFHRVHDQRVRVDALARHMKRQTRRAQQQQKAERNRCDQRAIPAQGRLL